MLSNTPCSRQEAAIVQRSRPSGTELVSAVSTSRTTGPVGLAAARLLQCLVSNWRRKQPCDDWQIRLCHSHWAATVRRLGQAPSLTGEPLARIISADRGRSAILTFKIASLGNQYLCARSSSLTPKRMPRFFARRRSPNATPERPYVVRTCLELIILRGP